MSGGREREWANSNLGRTNAPEFVVNNFIVKHSKISKIYEILGGQLPTQPPH